MSLLRTERLSASYGRFRALFDIDLTAEVGETIAVIGANGAGKSTLLQALSGLLPVAPDQVRLDGTPIGGLPAHRIVALGIALVPEGRRLFASLTVEENLLMGALAGRKGPWRLDSVYALFPRLAERRRQASRSMSGGEQQMAAIGRALMSNPRLLLCDELSLGLAPKIIGELYQAFGRIKREGMTLIIVEQSVQQALAVSDRAYCLQEGRVALAGRSAELTSDAVAQAYFGL